MQVYIGIDWSEKKHDVVFMNPAGVVIANTSIPHDIGGFAEFDALRRELGLTPEECQIGLETAHNLIIDYLWSQTYTEVYVLPPNVVKSNRGRFRQSRARDDQGDGEVIADVLRTDRGRRQPWHPDSTLTRQMRAKVSLILHLNKRINALSNRLRAVLLRYYPAALHVFSKLTTQIAPQFVLAYPRPQAARSLSYAEFEAFALQNRYPNPQKLPGCYDHLQGNYPEASPGTVEVYQKEAQVLARLLVDTTRAKCETRVELEALFQRHPDAPIFSSLPGTGDFLAPALLVKFGDDRQRFPTPGSAQALAGTCPVTDQSGKSRKVRFRRACDREWRDICQKWARALIRATGSPIARAYFDRVSPHCRSASHAYRCLANGWLAVAWKLWQTHQCYDPAYHFEHCAARSRPCQ